MSHNKPFHRNYRTMIQSSNSGYSDWAYIVDQDYAVAREHYTRAFKIIQTDLIKCFEFIEPADNNIGVYSFRTHELLMRACMEVEANFKAILKENIFNPVYANGSKAGQPRSEKSWNILDYKKINKTHRLSSYVVHIPIWSGSNGAIKPFEEWNSGNSLSWYQAYNKSKHDRHNEFHHANFKNMIGAISGLLVLLSSQFRTESFTPGEGASFGLSTDSYYDTEPALGGFFHIEFPSDWPEPEKYDFNWSDLKQQPQRFSKIDYDAIT
jgi:hypothetical protein